jgi:SAM-dependent methyltransferase
MPRDCRCGKTQHLPLMSRAGHHVAAEILKKLPAETRYELLWHTRPFLYRGDRVRCPCCQTSFSHLMTHRGVSNVRCPRCGSMERHRLLWLWLDAHPEFSAGVRKILHIAPEPPLRRRLDTSGGLYITADLESPLAAVRCDVQDLPFRDAWFDLVICNHVLEHAQDDRRALSELRRVLTDQGRAILLSPIGQGRATTFEDPAVSTPAQRLDAYGQENHIRLYGADYLDRVRAAGFDATAIDYLAALSRTTIERHALRRAGDIFEPDRLYLGWAR